MTTLKSVLAVSIALAATSLANVATAAPFLGTQTAFTVNNIPGQPDAVGGVAPLDAYVNGTFEYKNLTGASPTVLFALNEPYFDTTVTTPGGLSEQTTYTHLSYALFNEPSTYNSATRTLTANLASVQGDIATPFCVGAVQLCAPLFQASGPTSLALTVIFGATLSDFTGTAVFSTPLASGASESSTYAFTSQVPLPAGVWLLGSGLLGLADLGRRRQRAAA